MEQEAGLTKKFEGRMYYFFAFVILFITTTILINHAIKKEHSE